MTNRCIADDHLPSTGTDSAADNESPTPTPVVATEKGVDGFEAEG